MKAKMSTSEFRSRTLVTREIWGLGGETDRRVTGLEVKSDKKSHL